MSKFQFPESIKSRPLYGTLQPRPGKAHLMIADAEGAEALLELADKGAGLMARTRIVYIPGVTGATYPARLKALIPAEYHEARSYAASVQRLRHILANAHQGLQVYLAGTEGLMGQAQNEAMQAGIPHMAIQTEHRGSVARRVHCVHCKGITENVLYTPFQCSLCGLHLFVCDHYSRRLAAYRGLYVDAESPGDIPDPVALYP